MSLCFNDLIKEVEAGNIFLLDDNKELIQQFYYLDDGLYCRDLVNNVEYKTPYDVKDLFIDYCLFPERYVSSRNRSVRYG